MAELQGYRGTGVWGTGVQGSVVWGTGVWYGVQGSVFMMFVCVRCYASSVMLTVANRGQWYTTVFRRLYDLGFEISWY